LGVVVVVAAAAAAAVVNNHTFTAGLKAHFELFPQVLITGSVI
jgi:hypothetical protein